MKFACAIKLRNLSQMPEVMTGPFVEHVRERYRAEFRKGTDERYQMTIPPTIMLKGKFTRLWDAGYQKFLLTDEGLKLPALATHLQNLRKFNEELRTALGIPTFYNEALGSVSQVSVYDRVKGRKGAVPDETVGAHSTAGRR